MRPPFFDAAACRWVADPELFFPIAVDNGRQARKAQAVCRRCPVLAACGEYTVAHPELTEHGIWAGTTEKERRERRQEVNA